MRTVVVAMASCFVACSQVLGLDDAIVTDPTDRPLDAEWALPDAVIEDGGIDARRDPRIDAGADGVGDGVGDGDKPRDAGADATKPRDASSEAGEGGG